MTDMKDESRREMRVFAGWKDNQPGPRQASAVEMYKATEGAIR